MRAYIAGPMRDLPNFNFAAFDQASAAWRALAPGNEAINPADHDREVHPGIEGWVGFAEGDLHRLPSAFCRFEAMAWDIGQVVQADAIVLLPNWERSIGARQELSAAEATGKCVYFFSRDGRISARRTPIIIGLSGWARSGKDTAGHALARHHGLHRVAFGDKIKAIALSLLDPIHVEFIEQVGWDKAKQERVLIREALQRLGTEVRYHLGKDAWVTPVIEACLAQGDSVITDVRFPNEVGAIQAAGGTVWRVHRPGWGPANEHPSESALDRHEFDVVIPNEGTVHEFHDLVLERFHDHLKLKGSLK